MLKVTPLKSSKGSPADAAKYYKEEEKGLDVKETEMIKNGHVKEGDQVIKSYGDYVLLGRDDDTVKLSEWGGKLATQVGLKGKTVERDKLESVLGGKLGNDAVKLGQSNTRRMGFDLTFSAPKSVSIMALVYGDKRILEAHVAAVKEAMVEFEKYVPEVRVVKDSDVGVVREPTDNLIYAMETHKTSRKLDPQLHTHVLVANMTIFEDKLKAITIDNMYENKLNLYGGKVFQASLREKVEKLGYETALNPDGTFRIIKVPEDVNESFSGRRAEIVEEIEKRGITKASTIDKVAINSRDKKEYVSSDVLNKKWAAEGKGFDGHKLIMDSYEKGQEQKATPQEVSIKAKDALDRSISSLSKYQTKLASPVILDQAKSKYCTDANVTYKDLKLALAKKDSLIPLDARGTMFTTQALLEKEKNLKETANFSSKAYTIESNLLGVKDKNITNENKQTVASLLKSSKQTSVLEHYNSSSQVISGISAVSSTSNRSLFVLSPNKEFVEAAKASIKNTDKTLLNKVRHILSDRKDKAETLGSFNYNHSKNLNIIPKSSIVVVDQANKISINDAQNIIEAAKQKDSKVVFVGQKEGLGSYHAGNVIESLKQSNIKTYKYDSKQKDPANLYIHQDKDYHNKTASIYVKMTKEQRDRVEIIAPRAYDKAELTSSIRSELVANGELAKNKDVAIQKTVRLSNEAKVVAGNYPLNSNLTFFKKQNGKAIAYNYRIVGHDIDNNKVITKDANGKVASFNPEEVNNNFKITRDTSINIANGETIKIVEGNNKAKLFTGEYRINAIKDGRTVLENTKTGIAKNISDKSLKYCNLEHTYVKTIDKVTYENQKELIVSTKDFALNKELVSELNNKTNRSITIVTDSAEIAEKKMAVTGMSRSATTTTIESAKLLVNDNLKSQFKENIDKAKSELDSRFKADDVTKAFNFAIDKLSNKDTTFKVNDIFNEAINYTENQLNKVIPPKDILNYIDKAVSSDDLVTNKNNIVFTTKKALQHEKDILETTHNNKNTVQSLSDEKTINNYLDNKTPFPLSKGQKEAVNLITTTQDRFIGIQGFAGTGKSTMLEQAQAIKDLSATIETLKTDKKVEFIGLGPTHRAVDELKGKGINSKTYQSLLSEEIKFLASKENKASNSQKVYLLDESSMVSNRDMIDFMKICEKTDSRAVFIGDIKQLPSLSAGNPLSLLFQKNAVDHAVMTDIRRQKNDIYLDAVKSANNNNTERMFSSLSKQEIPTELSHLKQSVTEVKEFNQDDKANYIKYVPENQRNQISETHFKVLYNASKDYMSRSKDVRDNSIMIANTHTERDVIHNIVREELAKQQTIDKSQSIDVDRLKSLNIDDNSMRLINSYKPSQVFQEGNNNFYSVLETDKESRSVLLKSLDTGDKKHIFPENMDHRFNGLYEKTKENIAVGDKIMLRHTDKEKDIITNDRAQITSINKKDNTFIADIDGKKITLNGSNQKDMIWDYGYTSTTYSAQGATSKYVIPIANSDSKHNSTNNIYTQISRGEHHCSLHTADTQLLKKHLDNNKEGKAIAMSVLGKADNNFSFKIEQNNDKAIDDKEQKQIKSSSIQSKIKANQPTKTKSQIHNPLSEIPKETLNDKQFQDANGKFNIKTYAKEIEPQLVGYTESICSSFLGTPNKKYSTPQELAYGNSGALKVTLVGEHRGKWRDWSENKSGNLITLIMDKTGKTFTEAVVEANNIIGNRVSYDVKKNEYHDKLKSTKTTSKTGEYGKELWSNSLPSRSTLVDKYLAHRGIKNLDNTGLRFHSKVYTKESNNKYEPALMASFKDKNGKTQAVEAIYLDRKTGTKADLKTAKKTYGSKKGAAINLSPNVKDPKYSMVAEGVITGLSIKDAYPKEHVISVGGKENIQNLDPNILAKKVIICADNDGKDIFKDKALMDSIKQLKQAGKEVEIVAPNNIDGMSKVDFNDTLNKEGIGKLKEKIDHSISSLESKNISKNMQINNINKQNEILKIHQKYQQNQRLTDEIVRNNTKEMEVKVQKTKEISRGHQKTK